MQTNFFTQVATMNLAGNFRLNIQRQKNGSFIVSALLINDQLKEKTAQQIPPLVLSGFADDLDNGFFEAVTKPLQKNSSLLCNLAEHEKAMDRAKKESDTRRSSSGTSSSSPKRKKFDEQMKKVLDLETQKKYGDAIKQLPKEKDFAEYAAEIKQKSKELYNKYGNASLFDDTGEPEATTKTSHEEAEDEIPEEGEQEQHEEEDDEPPFDPDEEEEESQD